MKKAHGRSRAPSVEVGGELPGVVPAQRRSAVVDDERWLEQHQSPYLVAEAFGGVQCEHRARGAAEQRRRATGVVDERLDVLHLPRHGVWSDVAARTPATTS